MMNYFVFVQENVFNVQSATSPQCLNLPCSDTWSNMLSLRSEYTQAIHRHSLQPQYVEIPLILQCVGVNSKISV